MTDTQPTVVIYVEGTTITIPQEWIYEPPFDEEEIERYKMRNDGLT